mgnify:CR=1 FL=1
MMIEVGSRSCTSGIHMFARGAPRLSIPILVGVIRALLATILNGAFVSVPATR